MDKLVFHNHHNHSDLSINDCISKIPDIVKKSVELGMKSVTITDHGTLAGTYKLWKECETAKIKPIFGVEGYYVDDYSAPESQIEYNYSHIILLAKNPEGWENLKRIQSGAWENGYLKKPRIDFETIKKNKNGLICTTACLRGLIGWNYLKSGDKFFNEKELSFRKKLIKARLEKFLNLFGDDFYLELHYNEMDSQCLLNKYAIELSIKYKIKIVAANDCHYINKWDWKYHDIMICYARGKNINNGGDDVYSSHTKQLYFKDTDGMKTAWEAWHDHYISEPQFWESIKSTVEISDKVEPFSLRPKTVCLPSFTADPAAMMLKQVNEGWEKRLKPHQKCSAVYQQRLKYEIEVFNKLNMHSYMLVCADIIRRAKELDIPCGPGRGSVCGSLVAYCMDISQIDPILFKTSFDRFLVATRKSLPDIDMDFGRDGRNTIKELIKNVYGAEKFASIVTYMDWKPRGLIKDIGKVLGRSFQEMNDITKKIDDKTKKLEDEEVPLPDEIIDWLNENPDILKPAMTLEGINRQRGVHASGMILTPTDLENWTPTSFMVDKGSEDKKAVKVSEWDMYALEDLNILKIDFLGLQSLDIIKTCCKLINKTNEEEFKAEKLGYHTPGNVVMDVDGVWRMCLDNLDDQNIYKMMTEGHLLGLFQMETSEGMLELTKRMKPTCFQDVDLIISMYRTAVIQAGMMDEYLDRREGKEFQYIHPKAKPALEKTLGVMIYQEDLMQIAVDVGGMSLTDSDDFRKATKLKDPEKFKKWKDKFILGAKENGLTEQDAQTIWNWCQQFSGYGFNRCAIGSTLIYRFTGNQHGQKEITIEQLYKSAYEGNRNTPIRKKFRRQGHLGLVRYYNPEKHKIQYAKVKAIHKNGVQKVYRVLLENNFEFIGTINHRLMKIDKNYYEIKDLKIGDCLITCGDKDKNFKEQLLKDSKIKDDRHLHLKEVKRDVRSRAKNCCENCDEVLGTEKHDAEFHHKDGDHFNHTHENIILVCNSCHKKLDYKIGNRTGKRDLGYLVESSKIVSIEYHCEEETFDLEMFEEPHNFIANGIVSHNSHSAAYALITYATAYLKLYYPSEYMTAVMTWNAGDKDMMPKYLQESKRLNLKLRKPDINLSNDSFRLLKSKEILYPFTVIQNVGDKCINVILEERKTNGKFTSFENFYERINKSTVNVRVMINLILSGAFNKIEGKELEEVFDDYIEMRNKEKVYRQVYCTVCKNRFPCAIKMDEEQTMCPSCGTTEVSFETEDCKGKKFSETYLFTQVYGFCTGANPLKQYVNQISKYKAEPLSEIENCNDGQALLTAVYVKNIKNYVDKKGGRMAFVDVSDGEFDASITFFASDWEDSLEKEVKVGISYIIKAMKNRGNNLLYSTRGQIKSKLIRL